jgi:sigma-B regulation protein RsbU (phosphoserine phosphatase)
MSNLQATVRAHARRPATLDQVLTELNQLIAAATEPGRFITFFLGVVEPEEQQLRYANAGHDPPFLLHADGTVERLTEGGILLGAFPDAEYQCDVVRFAPGDVLVLFTDGVVEAKSGDDDYFDDRRLEELLRGDLGDRSAVAIRDRIVAAVRDFTGGMEQSDDVTVVVVRHVGDGDAR